MSLPWKWTNHETFLSQILETKKLLLKAYMHFVDTDVAYMPSGVGCLSRGSDMCRKIGRMEGNPETLNFQDEDSAEMWCKVCLNGVFFVKGCTSWKKGRPSEKERFFEVVFLQIVAIQHLTNNAAKWIHRGHFSNFTRFTYRSSGCGCCCRISGTKSMGQNKSKKGLVMMDSFLVGICCWKRGIRGCGYATPTLLFFYESWPSPSPKKAKFMKQFSSVSRNPIRETPLVPIGIPISHRNPIPQPRGKILGFAFRG